MSESPFVLAIDVGSSAVRAGLCDSRANRVEGTAVNLVHAQVVMGNGTCVEDAVQLAELVETAVDQVLELAGGTARHIAGVGMASMASTILGIDANGDPVTTVFTYADSRTGDDVEHLRQTIDVDAAYQRTGVMQHWSYVPARVNWLRRTRPDIHEQIDKWVDFPAYLYGRWFGFGVLRTSHSLAAWSGMQDRETLDWDTELLSTVGLSRDQLPAISGYDDVQCGLSSEYAARWVELRDARFALGVGDGAAVNIGTGCVGANRVAITVGTTAAMRTFAIRDRGGPLPEVPRGLWGYPLNPHQTLLGGAFTEGGSVVKWCTDVIQMPDLLELSVALEGREPAAHGLTVLPFLSGERAVGWAANATATVTGLRASTGGLDIVQAMMEAVAYRFALVAELLRPHTAADRVYVAGGNAMTGSAWWVQTIADVLGAVIHTTADDEATTRGAAMLALHAVGIWRTLSDFPSETAASFEPRAQYRAVHDAGIDRQTTLYEQIVAG